MPSMAAPTIPFIIRDLDKHPHEIKVPLKILDAQQQLPTPRVTPHGSPDPSVATITTNNPGMARSTSDLSSYSNNSDDDHRSGSSLSFRSAAFPFTNIFKWRKGNNSTGLTSPQTDDEYPPVSAANLDNLGRALQAQREQMCEITQGQLDQERKLRHIAEDRLTAVEEEVSRLCTVVLPTDNGDTGELYFANVLDSIRIAVDSYDSRATTLETKLQVATDTLKRERHERTAVDIECSSLRKQLTASKETQTSNAALESRIDELLSQNKALQDQLSAMTISSKSHSETTSQLTRELETTRLSHQKLQTDHDTLSQRLEDCEAQRDALRQVSQNLRQRCALESKKSEKQMRVLQKLDANIQSIQPQRRKRPSLERFFTASEM